MQVRIQAPRNEKALWHISGMAGSPARKRLNQFPDLKAMPRKWGANAKRRGGLVLSSYLPLGRLRGSDSASHPPEQEFTVMVILLRRLFFLTCAYLNTKVYLSSGVRPASLGRSYQIGLNDPPQAYLGSHFTMPQGTARI